MEFLKRVNSVLSEGEDAACIQCESKPDSAQMSPRCRAINGSMEEMIVAFEMQMETLYS